MNVGDRDRAMILYSNLHSKTDEAAGSDEHR
jgi:hypothetical protein